MNSLKGASSTFRILGLMHLHSKIKVCYSEIATKCYGGLVFLIYGGTNRLKKTCQYVCQIYYPNIQVDPSNLLIVVIKFWLNTLARCYSTSSSFQAYFNKPFMFPL